MAPHQDGILHSAIAAAPFVPAYRLRGADWTVEVIVTARMAGTGKQIVVFRTDLGRVEARESADFAHAYEPIEVPA